MTALPQRPNDEELAAEFLKGIGVSDVSPRHLLDAVFHSSPGSKVVTLPDVEQSIWDQGMNDVGGNTVESGIRMRRRREEFIDNTLNVSQVSELLGKDPSTVRHYKKSNHLYAFVHKNKLRFPRWQFVDGYIVPDLGSILPLITEDVHPEAVSGFFTHPNVDLIISDEPVSPIVWLLNGRDPQRVAKLARDLGTMI